MATAGVAVATVAAVATCVAHSRSSLYLSRTDRTRFPARRRCTHGSFSSHTHRCRLESSRQGENTEPEAATEEAEGTGAGEEGEERGEEEQEVDEVQTEEVHEVEEDWAVAMPEGSAAPSRPRPAGGGRSTLSEGCSTPSSSISTRRSCPRTRRPTPRTLRWSCVRIPPRSWRGERGHPDLLSL